MFSRSRVACAANLSLQDILGCVPGLTVSIAHRPFAVLTLRRIFLKLAIVKLEPRDFDLGPFARGQSYGKVYLSWCVVYCAF